MSALSFLDLHSLRPPASMLESPTRAVESVLAETGWSLRRLAYLVLDGDCPFEAECMTVAAAGAALRDAAEQGRIRLPEHVDTAVIAWAVERIAGRRIEDGDLGIDPAEADYLHLAETLLADTFDELREFDLCKLFVADRAGYRARRDLGRRHLAEMVGRMTVAAH